MTTITLEVHYPPADMPDADTDVLVFDASSPEAQLGAYVGQESEGPVWVNAQGDLVTDVVAWAEMPLLQKKPAKVAGRIGREPELTPLVNGRSVDFTGQWPMPV